MTRCPVDFNRLVEVVFIPRLFGRLVAREEPLLVKWQLVVAEAIVAKHKVALIESQRPRRVFRRSVGQWRSLDRMEGAKVGSPQPKLAMRSLHGLQQFPIAL